MAPRHAKPPVKCLSEDTIFDGQGTQYVCFQVVKDNGDKECQVWIIDALGWSLNQEPIAIWGPCHFALRPEGIAIVHGLNHTFDDYIRETVKGFTRK